MDRPAEMRPPTPRAARLVLHLDVNETLILSDPAGGDSYVDSLNKIVAKLALVRPAGAPGGAGAREAWVNDASDTDAEVLARWAWLDGTPLDPALRDPAAPPPPLAQSTWDVPLGAVRFYAVPALRRRFARAFCTAAGSPGRIYAQTFDEAARKLRWPASARTDTPLCRVDDGGAARHFLLPAALVAIAALARRGREFQLVVRTFGSDLDAVARALSAFARGDHPDFPLNELAERGAADGSARRARVLIPEADLGPERCFVGRYTPAGGYSLAPAPGAPPCSASALCDEGEIAELLARPGRLGDGAGRARGEGALGVRDDYDHWLLHRCAPSAGKPLWLTADDGETTHLFLDDNIHDSEHDSIVAVRARPSALAPGDGSAAPSAAGQFRPLSGEATRALRGLALVPVPTLRAVLDERWMLAQIDACEAAVGRARRSARAAGYGGDWLAWAVSARAEG